MSDIWRDLYKDHIERHRFQILDGRVSLGDEAPIRDGSYGDVYTGSLKSLQAGNQPERVAIKMIRGRSIDESDIRKFFREVHTWSKLDNDHILPLRGITLDLGRTLSIISPWMANGSAKKYISDGTVDPAPLLRDVATGLRYLHTREDPVYHGDLKGDNIMVTEDGRALLADFGFSVLVSSSFSLAITHPTGGTRPWMAPEKLAGKGDSAAADIYSFAMMTVELFTRKDPFHGEPRLTSEAIQNGRRPRKPTPDVTLNRLTDNWWNICKACWDTDPSRRWAAKQILESITQPTIKATDLIHPLPTTTGNETPIDRPITLTFIRNEGDGHLRKARILLTVTPPEPLPDNFAPIAWRILTLDTDTVEKALAWTGDFGFSTISQQEDGSFIPDSGVVIQIGQMSRLRLSAGKPEWSASENGNDQYQIAASNDTLAPVTLALSTVDHGGKYSPIVHLGRLQRGATVSSGLPLKLQAYAVPDNKVYTEGHVIEKQDLASPLFTTSEGISEPHDLQNLSKDAKFFVSDDPSGRLVLTFVEV